MNVTQVKCSISNSNSKRHKGEELRLCWRYVRAAYVLRSAKLNPATVNRSSFNIWCFHFTACSSSSCDETATEIRTNYIAESSSALKLITLARTSPLYTTKNVNVLTSTTNRNSAAFYHTTFYSGGSSSLNVPETSETQRYSLVYSQSDSVKLSTITIRSSFQTSTLESISFKLSSSSLSLVLSSSLSLLSTPSLSSSSAFFQTISHGVLLYLTPSPTRHVASSSMTPSPSTVSPTDGIEIEIQSLHNVSNSQNYYCSVS